jgi:outer membrane protein assembly factor BamA
VIRRWILPLLLVGFAGQGAAQIPNLPTIGRNWTDVSYPKVFYTTRDGLSVGLYYAQVRPMTYAEFFEPQAFRAILGVDFQFSTSGSKYIRLQARMPRLVDGWRFAGELGTSRRAREWYLGIGNDTELDKNNINDAQPHYYRSDNRSDLFRAEAQRRIIGRLRVLGGIHVERWRVDTLRNTTTLLAQQAQAGLVGFVNQSTNDIAFRFGLVFDTRNDEVAPRSGVLLQAIHALADSALGDLSYQRTTFSAQGYVPMHERLSVNIRGFVQHTSGTPGIGTIDLLEQSDAPLIGMGGARTHRALLDRRFLGDDLYFFNLDARYILTRVPTLYTVTLVGFYDTGRVFFAEDFTFTTKGLKHGGGAGIILQIFRAGLLGTTLGFGPDGGVLQFHTKWSF